MTQIVAAGAVVTRGGRDVLLVHRPRHGDWSFPKGKVDPGEHVAATAVREVAEETGLDVRIGPPLPTQRYPVAEGSKVVHYWVGTLVGGDDVTARVPDDEVDAVAWVPVREAAARLSYRRDRALLAGLTDAACASIPLLVLRHGKAVGRREWAGPDPERPLAPAGCEQAERLVPLLEAYGVQRVLSSSARRCWTTVAPYADHADVELEVTDALSQQRATPASIGAVLDGLRDTAEPAVVCTHRPVLPHVTGRLGVGARRLEPGGLLVVHRHAGAVVAVEHHTA